MPGLKPGVKKIDTVEDANLVLKETGLLEACIAAIGSDARKRIADVKGEAAQAGAEKRRRVAYLAGLLAAFAGYNKADLFRDRKTIALSFGIFGYRKSMSIGVKKTAAGLLTKLGLGRYIRVKAEPDKEAMAELDGAAPRRVGAARKAKDEFFCAAGKEAIDAGLPAELA